MRPPSARGRHGPWPPCARVPPPPPASELSWKWRIAGAPRLNASPQLSGPFRRRAGRQRPLGGSGPHPSPSGSGRAQVSSSAFVWRSPPPPAVPDSPPPPPPPEELPRRDPRPGRPLGQVLENPWPPVTGPGPHLPGCAQEPGRVTCPRAPEPRASSGVCPGVCPRAPEPRAPLATPCPAAPGPAERTGRAEKGTRCLGSSELGTRACLGCAPAESGLGPRGASYPRGRRRQEGPRGPGAGL